MKLRLVGIGRIGDAWLREGIDEYAGRLRRYLPLDIVELKEDKSGGKKPELARIRALEAERLLARVPAAAYVVALDEGGRSLSSEGLAALCETRMVEGCGEMAFVLGGPYGLAEEIRTRADLVLSLSALTLTHQMARLLLLEQLYRAMTIIRNEPYHNR